MKSNRSISIIILIIIISLFMNSCTDLFEPEVTTDNHGTRSSESECLIKNKDSSNIVTHSDIQALLARNNSPINARSKDQMKIHSITNEEGDTLLYLCSKLRGGWTLYSSDKRVPMVVGESDEGSLEDLMKNDIAQIWIKTISQDMLNIRKSSDNDLNFTIAEIEENRSFWIQNSTPDEYIKDKLDTHHYVKIDTTTTRPLIPNGHYEYYSSSTYREVYDSIPRLTTTNWHQGSPYNKYCPYKTVGFGRAPAGCVAISCAQMMYFLHDKYGIPRTAPSEAYCYGNVDSNDYDWSQTNYTEEVWYEMGYSGTAAAPLIADIGRRVNMKYGNVSSGASTEDLVDYVFAPYGISGVYTSYNTDILKSNLSNGLPVIISAYSQSSDGNFVGHSFLIDRYMRSREVVMTACRWVYDNVPENTLLPHVPDNVTYTYKSPIIDKIGMNWGWSNSGDNGGWFSLTGDWYVNGVNQQYNYNIKRNMIYINSISLQKPIK